MYFKKSNLNMSLNWIFDELLDYFNIDPEEVKVINKDGLIYNCDNKSKIYFLRFENLKESIYNLFDGANLLKLNSSNQKNYSEERKISKLMIFLIIKDILR